MVPPRPRAEPTLEPPARLSSIAPPLRQVGAACCVGLAWDRDDVLWGAEIGDRVGVSFGIGVGRYDVQGRELERPQTDIVAERVKSAPDGRLYLLEPGWLPVLERMDTGGGRAGRVPLPRARYSELDLQDVAAAPDGTLWLVDDRRLEVHHLAASGEHLGHWSVAAALVNPQGGGAHRVAVSPEGASIYVLKRNRVLRYAPDGRLLAAWGAQQLELGPDDFRSLQDLAVDGAGRVYILEVTGRIHVFEPDGWRVATWMAFDCPVGDDHGYPVSLALGPEGQVAVADAAAGRIHLYAPLGSPPAPPQRGPFRAHLPYGARPEGGGCGPAEASGVLEIGR